MTDMIRKMISKQTGKPVSDIAVVYLTACTSSKSETSAAIKMKDIGICLKDRAFSILGAFSSVIITKRSPLKQLHIWGESERFLSTPIENSMGPKGGT